MLELFNTPTSRKFEMKDKLHTKKHDKEILELLFPLPAENSNLKTNYCTKKNMIKKC